MTFQLVTTLFIITYIRAMTFEMSTDDKQGHDLPIVDLSVIMTFQPSNILGLDI